LIIHFKKQRKDTNSMGILQDQPQWRVLNVKHIQFVAVEFDQSSILAQLVPELWYQSLACYLELLKQKPENQRS